MQPEDYKETLEQLLRIIRIFPPEKHEELMDALLAVKVAPADMHALAARREMKLK